MNSQISRRPNSEDERTQPVTQTTPASPNPIMTTKKSVPATQTTPPPAPTMSTKRSRPATQATPSPPAPKMSTKRSRPATQTTSAPSTPTTTTIITRPATLTTPASDPKRAKSEINDGEVLGEYVQGSATPSCDTNYEAEFDEYPPYLAKAWAALCEMMEEIESRPPASALTELEDLKRKIASACSKEKELEATITTVTNQNKELLRNVKGLKDTIISLKLKNTMFFTRFATCESKLAALETENKKIKEELFDADKKLLGAKIAGFTDGLNEGKAKWLKSVEFLDRLTESSMQYFNYGFDSCQKQAKQQGFAGQLDKESALKNPPQLKGWESS